MLYKLAIPSIIFAFINFFPKKLIRGEGLDVKEMLADTIGGCSLWFTCSLAVVELLIFVLLLSRSNKTWLYILVSILLAFLGLWLIENEISIMDMIDFPWFYKRAMIAFLYVVCGGVYFKYERQIVTVISKWYVFVALVSFFLIVEFTIPEKALCLTSVGQMNVLGAIVSVIGSVLIIELCRKMKKNSVFTFIGKNSIVFYFFSGAIPVTLSAVLSRVLPINNVFGLMIVFLLSLSIGAIAAYIVKRWIPWLLDIRKVHNWKLE